MDAISTRPIDHPSHEKFSFKAVTGHRQRRFSLPGLPTKRLCLEVDPYDACPMRNPAQLPRERPRKQKTGIERMGECASQWRANASHHLALAESSAHREAMRLQEAARMPISIIAAARPAPSLSRNQVQGATGRGLRRDTRSVSGVRQSQPMFSQLTAPAMARCVTSALPDDAEESRAIIGEPRPAPARAGSRNFLLPVVQDSPAPGFSCSYPVAPTMSSDTPKSTSGSKTPESTSVALIPTIPKSQDGVKPAAHVYDAGVTLEFRTDSVISPAELNVELNAEVNAEVNGQEAAPLANVTQERALPEEPPREGIDEVEIAV